TPGCGRARSSTRSSSATTRALPSAFTTRSVGSKRRSSTPGFFPSRTQTGRSSICSALRPARTRSPTFRSGQWVSPMLSEDTRLRCIDHPLAVYFRIVGSDSPANRAAWLRDWARCARGNVFSHPAYLLDRSERESTPLAAIFDDAGSQVLFAFQLRRITHNACGEPVDFVCYDIATPLLYGGPLLDAGPGADRENVLARFWQRLRRWALAEGV